MSITVLPEAEWREAEGLKRVVAALHDDRGGPRFVGGAVRDTILGTEVTDVDLATMLLPETVIKRLEAASIKAIPTGIDHGTVTAVAGGKNYEITTLRRDVSTDGRRAIVVFAEDWKEDAARRDFTINALYADPTTGETFDYFDGLEDLDKRVIRFIGTADRRIAEDHLRVLRYFRFLARFGNGSVNDEAIAACAAGANSLMALSRERIAGELLKLLALPDPRQAISLMIQHNIFAPFLPELATGATTAVDRLLLREQACSLPASLPARLLSLLPPDIHAAQDVAMRLKLSNRLRVSMLARLENPEPRAKNIRSFAYREGIDAARDTAMLFATTAEFPPSMAMLDNWLVPEFGITGGDLVARGLPAGPIVAQTLKQIENDWIDEHFPPLDRTQMLADQAVAAAMLSFKNI